MRSLQVDAVRVPDGAEAMIDAQDVSTPQKEVQRAVVRIVDLEQVLQFRAANVVPVYGEGHEMPTHIYYRTQGSGGLEVDKCISNESNAVCFPSGTAKKNWGGNGWRSPCRSSWG